ncbi:M48 family metallopeptidase [Thalassotalea agarivorans]|uniref:YgjP-like metallopeptidase domain-containing protein n=1 Tax=Thalassotalea agarivorans TaxID=349064 RepID=A0A1I0APJ7_THASX|nr:SprT family zinc-dependent metalloprotease [Thalassotalea agarivorans]SES96306.1 hypothetical protein SAMN05660429_00779 [Thalassotalea agarivorans]
MQFPFQVIRSARRQTLAIQVKQGEVIVRAPVYISDDYINQLVERKHKWIQSKLVCQQQKLDDRFSYQQDDSLYWLGQKHRFSVELGSKNTVQVSDKGIIVVLKPIANESQTNQTVRIKRVLLKWLTTNAKRVLVQRVAELSALTGLAYNDVNVRQYKARWGSCNSQKRISLNVFLMMAPPWVVDYVIIHELCHTRHMNHSKAYWQLVQHHFPLYRSAKAWLNHRGQHCTLP